jgi:hypothetical protein
MARKILLETGYTFNPTTSVVSATGTVGLIVASTTSPWSATITGMTTTAGLSTGSFFTATAGTGSLGLSGTYRVTSILSSTSITFSAIGGSTPIAGTITNITPLAKQIVIPRYVPQERLVLITNVTTNQVIYNFSDPSLKATTYNAIMYGASGVTTLILNYNTVALSSTDKLQITIDEYVEKFQPAEEYVDPVNKFRISTPQALIDTDFEYGIQGTKWETVLFNNNRPFAYPSTVPVPSISGIALSNNARTVTVSCTNTTGLAVGTPIFVQDTQLAIANGNFIIETITTNTSFTYTAKAINTTAITAIWDAGKTIIYPGTIYTGAAIGAAPTIAISGNQLTVTTTVPHGLSVGNEIAVTGITGTNPPNGNYTVASVLSQTIFTYFANPIIGVPSGLTTTSSAVYVRPQGTVAHRAFDGGVLFSSNANSNNKSAIRQTRRYFRYQSGKGIQMSTGTIMRPYATIDSLTSSSTTVTVQTREPHNIQPGASIVIAGVTNDPAYNGIFTVTGIISSTKFTYTTLSAPSITTAAGLITLSVTSWYGAANRLGIFDQQNGMFWEFDGQTLFAVRRNSVFQLSGKVTVTNASNVVTRTDVEFPTAFSKQLVPGDNIVLRGQTYKVMDIQDDQNIIINPPYRGTTASYVVASKTQDIKTAQSSFNIDKLDGTGPSGYNIDLSKMQMFYIDYSWYGAGFIRFGVRGQNGDVVYAHKIANNNVNNEAYMRSGNLPAHYETNTDAIATQLTASVGASDTVLTVADTSKFPSSGILLIRPGSTTNQANKYYEYVNYTGKTTTSFTGLTRCQAGSALAGVTFTAAAGASVGTVASTAGLQIGQRVYSTTNPSPVPDGTFVTNISGLTVTLSNAIATTNPTLTFSAMATSTGSLGATTSTGQAYTYGATTPVSVEYAQPTFAPALSHWGSSVIMDGRFDDDKSLLFTYGQTGQTALQGTIGNTTVSFTSGGATSQAKMIVNDITQLVVGMSWVSGTGLTTGNTITAINPVTKEITLSANFTVQASGNYVFTATSTTKALFSIRVAPSVDSGIASAFSNREIINRMQLILKALDISAAGPAGNSSQISILVTAILNGVPSTTTAWTNVVGGLSVPNSSLAQIADYKAGSTTITGGEVTGGFFTAGTTSIDLTTVRDLGNAIQGGGISANSNGGIYPDGPDTLTIVVQNQSSAPVAIAGRLSWSEAQA